MYDLVRADESDWRALVNGVLLPDREGGSVSFTYDGRDYTIQGGRLIRDDSHIAVVYSPGYGGGFTTWIYGARPTDARVALLVLVNGTATISDLTPDDPERKIVVKDRRVWIYEEWAEEGMRGDELAIEWVPGGTLFKIEEYDGYESVRLSHDVEWNIA